MGIRSRNGEKAVLRNLKISNNTARKAFTRSKAEEALTVDNCSKERFTKHANKHVRVKAERLSVKNS